jgi:light-regulated signal transduction histidine kinase (bacteriophytochrome)
MSNNSKKGRPKELTSEAVSEILMRIAQGESVNKITQDEHLPSYRTFFRALLDDEDLQKRYVFVTQVREQRLFDQIIEIADSAGTAEDAQIAKVQIDARKWALSKMNPKKYAENNKPEVHVSTEITNNLPIVTVEKQRELQERRARALRDIKP